MSEINSPVIRILMVEDDELNIKMVSSFLKDQYLIDSVSNGDDAIRNLSNTQYNLVLMDIGLKKGLNGLEVTQRLRKIPGYSHTPVVALTAYALAGDKEKILSSGCTHYLSKPFTRHQLVRLLENILKED